jgi:hypothetical protein
MFTKLNYTEPSVLRGIVTALIALAASLGFVVTDDVQGAAEALIPIAAVVLPLLQSLWTRAAVWSPKSVGAVSDAAPGKHTSPEV